MESLGISKEDLIKLKDGTLFTLLFLWMIMPILQTIRAIYGIINLNEIYFILMKITGFIGIGVSIITIFDKIKNSENRKKTLKELSPIFIFILYMIWTLISCFLSTNTNVSFNGSYYRKEGYFMYLNYAGYFLSAFLIDSKKLRKILLNAFIVASLFLIIISRVTLDGQRYTNIFVNCTIETTVFAQFNHYCYYIMMTLMCCLGLFFTQKNKVLKVLYGIAYAIICYAMIYNDTFGSYLATACSLILYSIYAFVKKRDRIGIIIAIMIFLLLSCFTIKDNKNVAIRNIKVFANDVKTVMVKLGIVEDESGRTEDEITEDLMKSGTKRGELWYNGINFIIKNPIIGYGADNLKEQYDDVGLEAVDRPHNLLIYLACVSGIPGMLIYLTAVGIIIVKGIKKLLKDDTNEKIFLLVVVTYLISSMFGNSMFYTSPYFFIFLGSLMNCYLEKKEE